MFMLITNCTKQYIEYKFSILISEIKIIMFIKLQKKTI